jgi:hypothetical protein
MRRFSLVLSSLLFLAACGTDASKASSSADGSSSDAATSSASGAGGASSAMGTGAGPSATSGVGGASTSASTGGAGGGAPLDGYGVISGVCGDIDLEDIASAAPQLLEATLDFTNRAVFDPMLLTAEGQAMVAQGNLGGSSLYSEVFAFEMLERCDGAKLLKTEAEILYATNSKKTDILVEIDGQKVGVSVVRAMSYPEGAAYPVSQALTVLEGKLADILKSSASVAPEDAWKKQILSVLAQTPAHAMAIEEAYTMIDPATKADTIVAITVTEGTDQFIYYGK